MSGLLHRRDVVRSLLADRGDLLVTSGLGAPAWDITEAGDQPTSFPLWGAMGGATMLALGIAMAQPSRRVLCVTGDGEMLMALGSLATIAVQAPKNLSIVVLDNERYGETGMQNTHTSRGVDLAGMARSAGFADARLVQSEDQVGPLREMVYHDTGPNFAVVKIDPEKLPLVLPPREGSYLKNRFRIAVLGPGAVHDS